ncbi:MAG: VanZ family protein [Chitinophagaceae bacterium]
MNLQKYWRNNSTNKLTIVLFVIYLIALFWILLFKLGVQFSYMGNGSVNLIPFSDSKPDAGGIILNVLICVPLGIYAGVLFKRRTFSTKLFFFFLISSLFEVLQFILRAGAFDITDIITNTLGGIIGLMIFKAIEKLFKNSVKAQKFINIIAAIGTVLMISLLLLLKMNMLPVRYQ